MLSNILQCKGQPPQQSVNSVEVEKPWSGGILRLTFQEIIYAANFEQASL